MADLDAQNSTWPAGADVATFLKTLGLPLSDDQLTALNLDLAADAAVEKWHQVTGHDIFLAAEATLQFDPPGPDRGGSDRLFLSPGLWALTDSQGSAATTIRTGVTATSPGRTLTLGRDFWLYPANAPLRGKPFTEIRFSSAQYGPPQSISITGKFGRCLTLPAGVRLALLQEAVVSVAPQIALNVSRGVYEWKRGDESERYGGSGDSGPLASEVKQWAGMIERTATSYKRVSIS